ncbi:uncharacterized protein F5147DRAFT_657816 [Suillus discolor]|uniref:Uncharacterized protein n=1 Tax=Suillus discolor TaxID=1912936 RepID=A0A9P7JNE3_9AGAM|nr:uncharacterized protein F5147DRAFT_657816 [Suillus discolor]KAG2091991.1 hypothetical protein F5147DRAFT_657816 [Suillus discolor]
MAMLREKAASDEEVEITRDHVMQTVWPIHWARGHTDTEELYIIESMLEGREIQEPLMLYPRQLDITKWYYQLFYTAKMEDRRARNKIVSVLFPRVEVRGEVAVVKNGSGYNPRDERWDIDSVELGKTLWWYLKSKQDVARIANECRFINYLEQICSKDINTIHELRSAGVTELDDKVWTKVRSLKVATRGPGEGAKTINMVRIREIAVKEKDIPGGHFGNTIDSQGEKAVGTVRTDIKGAGVIIIRHCEKWIWVKHKAISLQGIVRAISVN